MFVNRSKRIASWSYDIEDKENIDTNNVMLKTAEPRLFESLHKSSSSSCSDLTNQFENDSGYITNLAPDNSESADNSSKSIENADTSISLHSDLYTDNALLSNPLSSNENVRSPQVQNSFKLDASLNTIDALNSSSQAIPEEVSRVQKLARAERILLCRARRSLSGVPPPPGLSLTAGDLLDRLQNNREMLLTEPLVADMYSSRGDSGIKSLLVFDKKEDALTLQWPAIAECRYLGIHHNLSSVTEELESALGRYQQRFVGGCETASTCGSSISNANSGKSMKRTSLTGQPSGTTRGSPGRRLSHLAHRRLAFSSSGLRQLASQRQILVPAGRKRKTPRKSPWKSARRTPGKGSPRKTPRKTPGKNTPRKTPGKSRTPRSGRKLISPVKVIHSTKRALFQSPDKVPSMVRPNTSQTGAARALFDEGNPRLSASGMPSLSRSLSCSSQMGDIESRLNRSSPTLVRRSSEYVSSSTAKKSISDINKKKLLWAVGETLKSRNIRMTHPRFKELASTLARVCRVLVPSLLEKKPLGASTSELMIRLARRHMQAVLDGTSAETIISEAMAASSLSNPSKVS